MTPRRLLIALVCLALLGSGSDADVINVPDDYPTIQGAVDAASDGDVIQIASGTYDQYGIEPGNKSITIEGALNTNGSRATTIDADESGSVFVIEASTDTFLTLRNLRIVNGDSSDGGGIDSTKCNITLVNCEISGNNASRGGGVWSNYGTMHLENCLIANNACSGSGGGIRINEGSLTVADSQFSDNFAQGSGGGLHTTDMSAIIIQDSDFTGNVSNVFGGGIRIRIASEATIENCVFVDNHAQSAGGAIDYRSVALQIHNSNISNNTCNSSGGGIYSDESSLLMNNCLVKSNNATWNGGGLYAEDQWKSIFLVNCEICSNSPDQIDGEWESLGGTVMEYCPYCPGDATGDGYIDVNDVLYLISTWNTADPNADFDEDGLVDADDVLILLSHYGAPCP